LHNHARIPMYQLKSPKPTPHLLFYNWETGQKVRLAKGKKPRGGNCRGEQTRTQISLVLVAESRRVQ